jgi:ubiquinol-cytochrome c reductase cytochrome b subunit
VVVYSHIIFLHFTGSTNTRGIFSNNIKIKFDNYFIIKDLINIFLIILIILFSLIFPFLIGDSENFILANILNSPIHIQPEWYFLYLYGILRSIPNKLGGVITIVLSLIIFFFLILCNKVNFLKRFFSYKLAYFIFINIFLLLTWIGSQSVEVPFIIIGQILTVRFFGFFLYIFIYREIVNYHFNLWKILKKPNFFVQTYTNHKSNL